jgi:predicted nucleic acid-binding protein
VATRKPRRGSRQIEPWRICAITYMELAQGCRDNAALQRLKCGLDLHRTATLPITAEISSRAMTLIDAHALSTGLRLADALIAATAIEHDLTVLTGNTKHFTPITALRVEAFAP